jgi:probable rRNA maturation factor
MANPSPTDSFTLTVFLESTGEQPSGWEQPCENPEQPDPREGVPPHDFRLPPSLDPGESILEDDRSIVPLPGEITAQQWESWFQAWLQDLRPSLPSPWHQAPDYELTLRFTDNDGIQTLNRQYRHQDRPTDVLAFAALESATPPPPLDLDSPWEESLYLGDIIIAVPTAQAQAQEQGHSLTLELAWLAAHGFLHLLGWDHPDEPQFQRMVHQQGKFLTQVGLNPPLRF